MLLRRCEIRGAMIEDGTIRVLPDGTPGLIRSIEHSVEERWLRAYSASLADTRPEYFDLLRDGGIVGHPVFPVCIEWPLVEHGAPGIELTANTLKQGLHVFHRTRLHTPIRPGQQVRTEAELYHAEARSTATYIATVFRTYSRENELIVTTHLGMLYRGVRLEGVKLPERPLVPLRHSGFELRPIATFDVDSTNAVIYSECARIWNPIHTDIRVAKQAGLPDTVLHGTETLARAVSGVTLAMLPGDATVTAFECGFTSPVYPGMTLTTNGAFDSDRSIIFDVQGSDGTCPISSGRLEFHTTA